MAAAALRPLRANLRHVGGHQRCRTFINARIKWVRDPYLDKAILKEKHLKPIISLKNQILSSPSKNLPLSSAALLKPQLGLPTTALGFSQKYPSVFRVFQPGPGLPLLVALTPLAGILNKEELSIHSSRRRDTVDRLAKLLMLTRGMKLPLSVIDELKWDLGLAHDYVTSLLCDYPDYFNVCGMKDQSTGKEMLCLELVSWRDELAVSELVRRERENGDSGERRAVRIRYSMNFPNGFALQKRVRDWVEKWQELPYISPYEDAFHLAQSSDQAEKYTVAVLHELLWILVSKKTERRNLLAIGEILGFGTRFRKALVHHPGIFYTSNKLRTQTVVLREAYRKDFLAEKHPLEGMRHRYIHLMNKWPKRVESGPDSRARKRSRFPGGRRRVSNRGGLTHGRDTGLLPDSEVEEAHKDDRIKGQIRPELRQPSNGKTSSH
ncbi:hypothetical protein CRG98_026629 [Punica granatum]|uniref:PORR domain-containing protein n=1 Tax=Punica granatum TaxID=22663 RepID=A0A2I0J9Y2_PUNGR|nr:hypothetical protein CRG98_026629 [Punica granatum]